MSDSKHKQPMRHLMPGNATMPAIAAAAAITFPQLRPPVPPREFINWWLWGALALGVILLSWLGFYLWKRQRRLRAKQAEAKSKPLVLPPSEEALKQLERLRPMIAEGQAEAFSTGISSILRHYIERRFEVQAEEMTTEEFLPHAAQHPELKGGHSDLLSIFLQRLDLAKFARQRLQTPEMEEIHTSATQFVRQTANIQPVSSQPLPASPGQTSAATSPALPSTVPWEEVTGRHPD